MKITLNKNILEQTLAQVNRIIERRVASPVLGCFLMETIDNNQVKLSATNLDITVINYIPCSVFDSGAYCLPTSLIFDITKKLVPNSNISFEDSSDLNTIKVTSNRVNFSIHST